MKHAFGAFLIAAVVIVAGWWWLGLPKPMPVAPLAPGDKLDCMSYAPFRGWETPIDLSTHIPPARIEEDLRHLATMTGCVRTYSVHQGLDQVAPIAERLGLKVMLGLWLGRDPEFNRKQIEVGVAIAKRHPQTIRAVVVGNEVLLRGEQSGAALAQTVRAVKAQVPVPVTYADVWEFWLRNRDLVNAVDFVTIHILPYWEDFPIGADAAADHTISIRRQVADSFSGKEIMIGEFGWPSAGRMREGALPSPSNQARVIQEVIARAKQEGFALNVIEAFDQPWKRQFEGTVGGHWGIFDGTTREAKFAWGQPVSDHPLWRWNALLGVMLAAAVAAAAFVLPRRAVRREPSRAVWGGVAIVAATSGLLIGFTVEQAMVESLGWLGHIRSAALLTIAIGSPIIIASALASGVPAPAFSVVLGRVSKHPKDRMVLLLGLAVVLLTVLAVQAALGLVFDPRYRDFPAAALTAPVVALAILRLVRPTGQRFGWVGAETLAAVVLAVSAVYVAFNESFVNWQAMWFCAAIAVLALILARAQAVPG